MQMKKILTLFALIAVMLAGLGLAGCGGSNKETASQTTGKEDSVSSLFARGKQLEGMSYDYILTGPAGTVMNGKVMMQGKQMKTETTVEGQQMVTLFDSETNTTHSYNPAEKQGFKLQADKADKKTAETPGDFTDKTDMAKAKIIENTTCDGVKCKVIAVQDPDGQ